MEKSCTLRFGAGAAADTTRSSCQLAGRVHHKLHAERRHSELPATWHWIGRSLAWSRLIVLIDRSRLWRQANSAGRPASKASRARVNLMVRAQLWCEKRRQQLALNGNVFCFSLFARSAPLLLEAANGKSEKKFLLRLARACDTLPPRRRPMIERTGGARVVQQDNGAANRIVVFLPKLVRFCAARGEICCTASRPLASLLEWRPERVSLIEARLAQSIRSARHSPESAFALLCSRSPRLPLRAFGGGQNFWQLSPLRI